MSNIIGQLIQRYRAHQKKQEYRRECALDKLHNMTPPNIIGKTQAIEKLREFGYDFNEAGQLRKIDENTGELTEDAFEFNIYDNDQKKNQERYDAMGEHITEIVYSMLEENGLSRIWIPEDVDKRFATFFFSQPAQLFQSKKLLIILHGSGYVRAGQWARSIIMNHSIEAGSMIPYIKRAQALGYDIIIPNGNDCWRTVNGKSRAIAGLNNGTAHLGYIFEKYILPSDPESVAMIAHSYGGALTINMAKRFPKFFKERVFAIALTDSAHPVLPECLSSHYLVNNTRNWAASEQPIDTKVSTINGDFPRVSSGHIQHEWTSHSAIDSVFKFVEDRYDKFQELQAKSKLN